MIKILITLRWIMGAGVHYLTKIFFLWPHAQKGHEGIAPECNGVSMLKLMNSSCSDGMVLPVTLPHPRSPPPRRRWCWWDFLASDENFVVLRKGKYLVSIRYDKCERRQSPEHAATVLSRGHAFTQQLTQNLAFIIHLISISYRFSLMWTA